MIKHSLIFHQIYTSAAHDSPVTRIVDVDLFDVISEDVLYFEQLGSVLLAGDWNARVGKKIDYIDCDANVSDIDDYDYRPDNPLGRASQDSVCNPLGRASQDSVCIPRGTKMLDLCKSLSLRIANGRLGHDFNKGELPYFSQHSQSIIDYLTEGVRVFINPRLLYRRF